MTLFEGNKCPWAISSGPFVSEITLPFSSRTPSPCSKFPEGSPSWLTSDCDFTVTRRLQTIQPTSVPMRTIPANVAPIIIPINEFLGVDFWTAEFGPVEVVDWSILVVANMDVVSGSNVEDPDATLLGFPDCFWVWVCTSTDVTVAVPELVDDPVALSVPGPVPAVYTPPPMVDMWSGTPSWTTVAVSIDGPPSTTLNKPPVAPWVLLVLLMATNHETLQVRPIIDSIPYRKHRVESICS